MRSLFFPGTRKEKERRKERKKKLLLPEPERPSADPGLVVRDHPLVDVLVARQERGEEDAVSVCFLMVDEGGRGFRRGW